MKKSLLEIQKSVRELENKIGDISKSIQKLYLDIEGMRTCKDNTVIDYSKIEALAAHIPFSRHPICNLGDERICRIYLKMLLNIARMDEDAEITVNRLAFLQWLQKEANIDWSLEDLYKDCFGMKVSDYHEVVELIPVEYFEHLVVDALMVANIGGTAKSEIYEYIVDLVSVLDIDKGRFDLLAIVSKTALCKKLDKMKKNKMSVLLKMIPEYKHYIDEGIIERELKSFRRIVVEKDSYTFDWKVHQGQTVEKNQLIATYSDFSFYQDDNKIFAPFGGTIFIFKNNGIYYGVISHPNDNRDSIKAWVKSREIR